MDRRHFLTSAILSAIAPVLAQEKRAPRIVLRSSWQTVNIGDIAHTPGVLHLLEQHLPEAEIRLWPSSVSNGVDEMLMKRFPKLKIIKGREDILAALKECDFLLHGSGPGFVAQKDVAKWRDQTGKPYGIYCITYASKDAASHDLLTGAKFVYFRDSVSLKYAQDHGVKSPLMEFCPEGSFAVDLRNDAAADAFLKEHQLEQGKFLCCIPRYRNTPYWKIKKGQAFDEKKHARNEAMKEHDLAPLREAIVQVVKQTDMKVLVCPEDASQMEIGKEMLIDKLPADVKDRVAWRPNYWLTDEALSTYVRSAGLFGAEMHSPIMCIGNGIPAIVCRWAEQTSKGLMWRDIGLGEWLFNIDEESEIPGILPAVLAMAKDPAAAKAKAEKARDLVNELQRKSMEKVKELSAPA
ncbi:MAG: polysaccharide pyruvyl transferase family protein [Verrucomicrobiota bacterium]